MGNITIKQDAGVYTIEGNEKLVATISGFLPASLKTQFEQAAGDTEEKLEQFLTRKHQQLLDAIPEDFQFLLQTLAEFDSASVKLVDLGKKGAANKAYEYQIGASASLELAAVEADELTPPATFSVPDGQALLGLGLAGSANLAASAKGSHGILGASVSASVSTEQRLAYYGSQPAQNKVLPYLLGLPGQIADPTDLNELIERLDSGVLLRFERSGMPSMKLGLTVEIGPALKEFAGSLPISTELGGNLSVQYNDSSRCRLILEKAGPNSYQLDLVKSRKKTLSKSLQLGIDVQLVGFRNQLLEKVTRALPQDVGINRLLTELDGAIEQVTEDKLKARLRDRLKSEWPKGKAAIDFLVGEKSADKLAGELQTELEELVLEAINTHADPVNQQAGTAATKVAVVVSAQLRLPLERRDSLEDYLTSAVTDAVDDFQTALEDKLTAYIKDKGQDLKELLEPWEFIGSGISEAIASVGSNAQAALNRVREALVSIHKRYTALRQQILKVIKEDFEEKVALTITAEKERTEQSNSALRLQFTHASELVHSLYQGLWNGNLQKATSLLQDLANAPETVRLEGEYEALVREVRSTSLAINFFGVSFLAEELFSADTRVALNANGILVVAKGEGMLLERTRFWGETQSVTGKWTLDPLADTRLTPPVVIKISVADNEFEVRKETGKYFGILEDSGLVRSGLGDEVESKLDELGLQSITDLTLSFSIVFRWSDWLRLLAVDAQGQELADAISPDEFSDQYLMLLRSTAEHYVDHAERLFGGGTVAEFKQKLLSEGKLPSWQFKKKYRGSSGSFNLRAPTKNAQSTARYVHYIHTGLIALRASWVNLIKAMPEEGVAVDMAEMDDLRRHITAVNNDLANLLDSSTRQLSLDQTKLAGFTAAGLKLLASQTNLPNPYVSCVLESEATGKLLFN